MFPVRENNNFPINLGTLPNGAARSIAMNCNEGSGGRLGPGRPLTPQICLKRLFFFIAVAVRNYRLNSK